MERELAAALYSFEFECCDRDCEDSEHSPEISTLETRRLALSDMQGDLEARVEDIEKTIGKAPEEE